MIPMLFYLVPTLFLGGIFSAVAGGGLGILMTVILGISFPIQVAVVLSSLLAFAIQTAKMFHFRGHIRWDVVWWYALPGLPVAYGAGFLLFLLPDRVIEIAIGTLCLWMGFTEALPGKIGKPIRLQPHKITLAAGGIMNGFIAGIIGNGAVFRAPLLLAFGLRKETFIGTSAIIAFLMNLSRASAYVQVVPWSRDIAIMLLALMPALFVSVWIGKRMLPFVSVRAFELLQAGLMLVGAIALLWP